MASAMEEPQENHLTFLINNQSAPLMVSQFLFRLAESQPSIPLCRL